MYGTRAYTSPEQAESRPVDRRTEIFSLGGRLYETAGVSRSMDQPQYGDRNASTFSAGLDGDDLGVEVLLDDLHHLWEQGVAGASDWPLDT